MAQCYFLVCYKAFKMSDDLGKNHNISEIALKLLFTSFRFARQ